MAYNPFNIFRRNQKALFAVLTVFIMIMFTLQSGVRGGDFFETLSRWLGGTSGGAVCKIDGHTVSNRELDRMQFKRVMANRFMFQAALDTSVNLQEYIKQQQPRLSEAGKEMAISAGTAGMLLSNPQLLRQFGPQGFQMIQQADQRINQILDSPTAKTEDKDVARACRTLFQLQQLLSAAQGEHYFINAPGKNRRDLIDFLLWQKKAQQLGVRFSREDVKRLIDKEFSGSFKSDVRVRQVLQQTPGFNMEDCLDAIAAEFEVRTAQMSVLGPNARFGRVLAYPTPYETFEYYRDQCSPASYEVIPVPAAGFVNQVTAQPSETELRELFRNYENAEPSPKSETPGFKEPRKISVAYIGITGEEPYYKKLAAEQVKVGEVMARASGMLTVPLPGATSAWAADAVAALSLKDPAVDAEYNIYLYQFKLELKNEYTDSSLYARGILSSSIIRPGVLAATAGGFVGQAAGGGNPIAAASIAMGAPIAYEIRDRVKVGVPLVLAWAPSPALLPTLVMGTATSAANLPKPLPIDYMRAELLPKVIDKRARELAFGQQPNFNSPQAAPIEKGDVERFIDELKKLSDNGKPKDKAAVEKYINDFVAARGLTHRGASTAPHDEWTIEDDPGLQPLVRAQKDSLKLAAAFHGGNYVPFGQSFFWSTPEAGPRGNPFQNRRASATTGLYLAEKYPPGGEAAGQPHYVMWRTEDIPAKKTNFNVARPAAVEAWKRLKAREIAKARAEQLAEAIRAYPQTSETALTQFIKDEDFKLQTGIADQKARLRARDFRIDNVCPLVSEFNQPLRPFELRESEHLPYPTPEMRAALLDNRDKPIKTVLVLPDAPKDTFYVATLVNRQLKTPEEFRMNVYSPMGNAQVIRLRYESESMNNFRQSVVDLLKKEFRYEETEEQKKKLDENAKSGGQGE